MREYKDQTKKKVKIREKDRKNSPRKMKKNQKRRAWFSEVSGWWWLTRLILQTGLLFCLYHRLKIITIQTSNLSPEHWIKVGWCFRCVQGGVSVYFLYPVLGISQSLKVFLTPFRGETYFQESLYWPNPGNYWLDKL